MKHDAFERNRKMPRFCREQRGMTLVEVLVSMTLLAVVTLLVAGMLMMGLRMLSYNLPRSQLAQKAALKADGGASGDSSGVTASSGTFTVQINGQTGTVGGTYRTGTQSSSDGGAVTFWTFTPDSNG